MQITYFFRKKNYEFSIERVFMNVCEQSEFDTINKYVKYNRITIYNILINLLFCYRNRGYINHITGDIYYCMLALPAKNTIITFHDLGIVLNTTGFKKWFYYYFWYYLPAKKARYITCISKSTKNELVSITKCNEKKIVVIPNPISTQYSYSEKIFNTENPVILHIGTRDNKNLERVIEALKGLTCTLRIIGKLSPLQTEMLHDNMIQFSNSFELSDKEILNEYLSADIVSFPSLFEGFGMPVIEAQSIGRVVLCSEIDPLTQVSGGAACFVNPYDIKSINEGFKLIISNNEYRENLIIAGLENAKKYSPQKIAAMYNQVYNTIENSL